MAIRGESELVSFDAEAALAAVRGVAGEDVLSVTAFTHDAFDLVFVAEEVLSMYRDEDHLREHYDRILAHLHLDFMERDTMEKSLLPNAGQVRAVVTWMDEMVLLRAFGGADGLYVALAADADVGAVVDALAPVLEDG